MAKRKPDEVPMPMIPACRLSLATAAALMAGLLCVGATCAGAADKPVPVTALNFARAESDLYFASTVKNGGFGKFEHKREMTPIDKQDVVRMNRDTLYSSAVFDLDAGPVTVTLPDSGKRFMSMLVISEDHYAVDVVYAPGRYTYDKNKVGTRYAFMAVRTLANSADAEDVKAAHALQDAIKVEQSATGTFAIPDWDAN